MSARSTQQLREDARAIWRAGVDAVDSHRLVLEHLRVDGGILEVGSLRLQLSTIRRIVVVGAGKAGAGMAAGALEALGPRVCQEKQLTGWLNVPADCVRPLERITLHAARPAGRNEPTAEGVAGAEQILRMIGQLTAEDLCLCLLSGGGSALLPLPVETVPLSEKQALTAALSAAGANIQQLNTVRKQLSRIKGGGLARACRAGVLATLIISDVIGDPLGTIASGPTTADDSTAADALSILGQLHIARQVAPRAFAYLEMKTGRPAATAPPAPSEVMNLVIGNNATAVDAAGVEAERRGYSHAMHVADRLEGSAEEVGRHLAQMALRMRSESGPDCLITGGEPTVRLVPAAQRGLGGRNQQLVLAAYAALAAQAGHDANPCRRIALLSGGTDGEDGPTDAAGAWIDEQVAERIADSGMAADDYLARNDAYHFFARVDGLLKTGPTHTNVCDLRVVVTDRAARDA